jgi:hypothetical protein
MNELLLLKQENEELKKRVAELEEHLKKYTAPARSKTYYENQHKRYIKKDEEIRYEDLYMLHGGKFIFIRLNPDKFINQLGTTKNPCMKTRMEYLKNEIIKQMDRIYSDDNTELLEIYYLFYDGYDYKFK